MLDLLTATAVFTVIVAVLLLVLSALTLVPFVVSLQMAEARGLGSARWGAASLVGSAAGLLTAALVLRSDRPPPLAAAGVLLVLLTPALLLVLPAGSVLGGRSGRHE